MTSTELPGRGNDEFWRDFLTRGHSTERVGRRLFKLIPREPRCRLCAAPFSGFGAPLMRVIGKRPSDRNPNWCSSWFTRHAAGGINAARALLAAVGHAEGKATDHRSGHAHGQSPRGLTADVLGPPPLVRRALALAERLGFGRSCSVETGRLLLTLAAQRGRARVAEIGTGCGVGAAWILAGLAPDVPFVSVERDERLAGAARELLRYEPNARVLAGDWSDVFAAEAPFDLLFVDAREAKSDPAVVGLLAPGGTAVLDDLTPGRRGTDPVRELWLGHPDLAGVELGVNEREAVILATRVL